MSDLSIGIESTLPVEMSVDMAAMLVHELRRPLTSIRAYAELLDDRIAGELTESQGQFVGRIVCNADRLDGQLQRICEFVSALHGELSCEPGPCDLEQICRRMFEAYEERFRAKEIEWDVVMLGSTPLCSADHDRIERSLEALLDALLQTPEGLQSTRMELSDAGGTAKIEIMAAGGDWNTGTAEAVFDPLGPSVAHLGEGLGIDPFLARATIAAHGGTVEVTSREMEAGFAIELPLVPTEHP